MPERLVKRRNIHTAVGRDAYDCCYLLALSWNAPKRRLYNYFEQIPPDQPIVVAIGAMAKGEDNFADSYADDKIGKLKELRM